MEEKTDILCIYIGSKIEEIRELKGITQNGLAESIGMSRPSIVNIEKGRQTIKLLRVYQIAEMLNVPLNDLLPPLKWYAENKNKKLRKVISFEWVDD